MSGFIPLALACGHVVTDQAMFQAPAAGSGEPELVECPEGCGMVEYVLPPGIGPFNRENVMEIDLGYLEACTEVEFDVEPDGGGAK